MSETAALGGERRRGRTNRNVVAPSLESNSRLPPDDGENPLLKIAGQRELLLIPLLAGFFGLASAVNVGATPDKAGELSSLVGKGNATIEYPSITTCVAAQAVLHLKELAPVEPVEIVPDATFDVVAMYAFRPAVAHLLLERASREREPGLVEHHKPR